MDGCCNVPEGQSTGTKLKKEGGGAEQKIGRIEFALFFPHPL
jgi:hypothetical protein